MGIRFLNNYLNANCQHSIHEKKFSYFANKVIVIDSSIYIYKYLKTDNLLEGIYSMIIRFKKHNITPIFVFDGRSIEQKSELISMRKEKKYKAKEEYDKLAIQYKFLKEGLEKNKNEELMDITERMDELKKTFVQVKNRHIEDVKRLLEAFNILHFTADNEADILCAYLVKKNFAYACLSEDMDMFVYGCPRVLRYMSVMQEKMVLYDFHKILHILNMDEETFRAISILSGTDYNIEKKVSVDDDDCSDKLTNYVNEYMNLYKLYSKQIDVNHISFEKWLLSSNIELMLDTKSFYDIKKLFDVDSFNYKVNMVELNNISKIKHNNVDKEKLKDIMKNEHFFFLF